jgi:hypothetical protein
MTCRLEVFYFKNSMTRHRIPASSWYVRVEHGRISRLSAQVYAHENNIGLECLKYWVRRIDRIASGPKLLPVRVGNPASSAPLQRNASGWSRRIDGGADGVWLARLLQKLR